MPERPRSVQGGSARPQSRRFLKETLSKLSDDSIRIGKRLVGEPETSRSPSPHWRTQAPLALPDQASSLAALQGGDACAAAAATEAEVEADARAKEQHWDKLGPFEVRDSMLAVSKIIAIWERDISKAAEAWARHIDMQVERNSMNNQRWEDLQRHLTAVQDRLETIDKRICDRDSEAVAFEEAQRDANCRSQEDLRDIARAVGEAARQSATQVEALGGTISAEVETVKARFKQLIYDEEVDGKKSISSRLLSVSGRLGDILRVAEEDVGRWKTSSDRWHDAKEAALSEVRLRDDRITAAHEAYKKLQDESDTLSGKLLALQEELAQARAAPGAQAFTAVKVVEKNGRTRFDRQSGQIDVLRGLEFVPSKASGQPAAKFKNEDAAVAVLGDIAELWQLFNGPVDIEVRMAPGKGGKPEFWDKVAHVQVTTLKEELQRAGVPSTSITTKSSQAVKGVDPGVIVTLKRDVFADPLLAEPAKAKKSGSASPR